MWNKTFKLPLVTILMTALVTVLLIGIVPVTSIHAQEGDLLPMPVPATVGVLIGADYWSDEPMILSAGMGFDGIIGIDDLNETTVRDSGAGWFEDRFCPSGEEVTQIARTAAVDKALMAALATGEPDYHDAVPVVFSWPMATETVDAADFEFTLNNGDTVPATSINMFPNWEYSERNVVIAVGQLGNRGLSTEDDALYPVKLEIVGDLILVGPSGQEANALGLTWETGFSPYDQGPRLVGAKINRVEPEPVGEGGPTALEVLSEAIPNDELALYDEGDFRIRTLTSGGFSPDGVTALRPDHYEDYFRIHAIGPNGETVLLEEVGVDYEVAGGTLRVIGLEDTGQPEDPAEDIFYDVCYAEDRDNYIDIILVGDEEAARNVTFVEIPSLVGGYRAFYNPGGPGPDPFPGVRYTAPGPPDLEPVINALDDPMRVTRIPSEPNIISLPQGDVILAQNAGMTPESIEWDATNSQFLVGSVAFGNVFSVQDTGVVMPFIESDNLTNTVGVHIDAETNRLLVANGDFFAAADPDLLGFAQLGIYDMETREELHFVELGELYDGRHLANDVTVDADGNAYVTDSLSPVIYKVDMDGNAEVFVESPDFTFLNGIDYHPDGYLLVGANGSLAGVEGNNALYKVPLEDPANLSKVESNTPLLLDGFILTEDLNIVGVIQPPVGNVVQISSDDDWATATMVATAPALTPRFPTAVILRDGDPYVSHAEFGMVLAGEVPLAYAILRTSFTSVE